MKFNARRGRSSGPPKKWAELKAKREKFRDWHPGLEELLARKSTKGPYSTGAVRSSLEVLGKLKAERQRQGLTRGGLRAGGAGHCLLVAPGER